MSVTAQSHGLDGTLVEPDWPPLAAEELRTFLRRFHGLDGEMEILSTSPRPFSAAGVVAVGSSRVFVKRHHRSVRDREGLLEEHRFIAHLRAHHLPTPEVLQTEDGETTIEAGEWTYEVHKIPAGVDLYQEAHSWTPFRSLEHARSAGRMLARLHIAARDFTAPRRKPQPLVAGFTIFAAGDPADAMREYIAERPALGADGAAQDSYGLALDLLAPFHAELLPHLSLSKPCGHTMICMLRTCSGAMKA